MSRIPEFLETLKKMQDIHIKKNEDYATNENPFANFDFSDIVMRMFPDRDKTFVWPISTKLARLSSLLTSGNKPNNESIEDSFDDIAIYVILWKCDWLRRQASDRHT